MNSALGTTGDLSITSALGLSVLGFAIVFFVLIVLMLVINVLRSIIGGMEASKAAPAVAAAPVAVAAPARNPNMVPAKGSVGEVKLHDVDDTTAALIMAIVANELNAPLNELRFHSIREKK